MHANRRVFASAIAATGSSNAPGTGITVTCSRCTPASSSSARALSSSFVVTSPLNFDTTMPTARRAPTGSPSSTGYPGGTVRSPGACSPVCSSCSTCSGSGSESGSDALSPLAGSALAPAPVLRRERGCHLGLPQRIGRRRSCRPPRVIDLVLDRDPGSSRAAVPGSARRRARSRSRRRSRPPGSPSARELGGVVVVPARPVVPTPASRSLMPPPLPSAPARNATPGGGASPRSDDPSSRASPPDTAGSRRSGRRRPARDRRPRARTR